MKKAAFKSPTIDHLGDAGTHEKEPLAPKASSLQNPAPAPQPQNLNPTGTDPILEKRAIRHPKKQEPAKVVDPVQIKLISTIREMFLDIRQRTANESPDCALILKKQVPFEESEERILTFDPLILLHHIKKIFDKVLELKCEMEKDAALKNDNECGDYEVMLQKLEAEVRQHIRIEQQLKLYVESVQAKLEDQEKELDNSKLDNIQNEVDNLKQENMGLNEKMKQCKDEMANLKKKMHRKVEQIEKLEKQLENIPVLKKIVKEMDRVLDGEPTTWSVQESLPIGSQRSTKEFENHGYLNTFGANNVPADIKARKRSQPVVGYSQDKNRESNEFIRVIDASVQFNEGQNKRESFGKGKSLKESSLKQDGPSIKSTARLEDKAEDIEDALRRPRKSAKGESNRQSSKDRERQNPDQEGSGGDNNIKEIKAIINAKMKEDMIEASKFSCEPAFKAGMEEYLKKSFEKQPDLHNKSKSKTTTSYAKKNKTHVLDNSKDKIESLKAPSRKNSASKATRPATGERVRQHERTQHSPDQHHTPDPYRGKEGAHNKRQGHDRSQSVEARKKLVRQHKSRASINEDEIEESHKKQASFNAHYKGAANYLRMSQGSSTFVKNHS